MSTRWLYGAICLFVLIGACSRSKSADAPAVEKAAPAPATPPQQQQDPVAHGAELYGRMCAVCHGAHGEGYKADHATALAQPDFLASVSDEYLGFAIAMGRTGTTMSAWFHDAGGPLNVQDIYAIISFLRTWQKTPPAALDEKPPQGDPGRGKAIFARECERCHGPNGPEVRILGQQQLAHATPGFLRHALKTGRPPTPMPSFSQTLGDAGIEDVVAYMLSLKAQDLEGPPRASRPPPIPLGPVPLNPKGPEPKGFKPFPAMTSVDVVAAEYKRKAKMVIIDARVPSDYENVHIAGAVSVPFYDPDPYFDELPKSAWLVCYCGCPHAESGTLARKLAAAGFTKVTVLDEGLFDWIDKGHAVSHGRAP
jgi:cytochrome c oxidase cbb3-type subunit 3/ubiquinol-cytochrome c reductase cytochrome c subunit